MPLVQRRISAVEGYEELGVYVRQFNALEFARAADATIDIKAKSKVEQAQAMAVVCAMACCNVSGEPLFSNPEAVLEEPTEFLEACLNAAYEINDLDGSPVETEVKN